jgi:hypothetical protein
MKDEKSAPALRDLNPRPESHEAKIRGCTCTLLRNKDGREHVSVTKGCPVHG